MDTKINDISKIISINYVLFSFVLNKDYSNCDVISIL